MLFAGGGTELSQYNLGCLAFHVRSQSYITGWGNGSAKKYKSLYQLRYRDILLITAKHQLCLQIVPEEVQLFFPGYNLPVLSAMPDLPDKLCSSYISYE